MNEKLQKVLTWATTHALALGIGFAIGTMFGGLLF